MHVRCLMLRQRMQTSSPRAGREGGTPCTTSCRVPPTPRDESCPSHCLCPSCTSTQEGEVDVAELYRTVGTVLCWTNFTHWYVCKFVFFINIIGFNVDLFLVFLQMEMALTTARAHPPRRRGRLSRGTAKLLHGAAGGQRGRIPAATATKLYVQRGLEGW